MNFPNHIFHQPNYPSDLELKRRNQLVAELGCDQTLAIDDDYLFADAEAVAEKNSESIHRNQNLTVAKEEETNKGERRKRIKTFIH
jgi:hypothetical protein